MSIWRKKVVCPNCGESFQATFEQYIDLGALPHLRSALENGEVNFFYCPNCGNPAFSDGFAIDDPAREQLIIFVPDAVQDQAMIQALQNGMPFAFGASKPYWPDPQVVDKWPELMALISDEAPPLQDRFQNLKLVDTFLAAPSLEALMSVIRDQPELLTDDTILALGTLFRLAREQQNPVILGNAIVGRLILEHCREQGIDAAQEYIQTNWSISQTGNGKLYIQIAQEEVEELIMRMLFDDIQLLEPIAFSDHYRIPELIGLYLRALQFPEVTQDAPLLSSVYFGLGYCYHHYPNANIVWKLRRALDYLERAVHELDPGSAPDQYANIQNELGLVWLELPTGDLTENLYSAIACFQEALRFRTPENSPENYAASIHNLGLAMTKYTEGEREQNLLQAMDYFQEALQYHRSVPAIIKSYNSLGSACYNLAGNDNLRLKKAIEHYRTALALVEEQYPDALLQRVLLINLGYACLASPDPGQMAVAIRHFERALALYPDQLPAQTKALIYEAMATACNRLPEGDELSKKQKQIHYLQTAMQCFPILENAYNEFPADIRRIALKLGDHYFSLEQWSQAIEIYREAVVANETLTWMTASPHSLEQELNQTGDLFVHYAYALARQGAYESAVRALEAGRTQILHKSLLLDTIPLEKLSPKERSQLTSAKEKIKSLEQESRLLIANRMDLTHPAAYGELSRELRETRSLIRELTEAYSREADGPIPGETLFQTLAAAMPSGQALIYLLTTSRGSLALMIPGKQAFQAERHLCWIPDFNAADLRSIMGKEPGTTNGYLPALLGQGSLKEALSQYLPILERKLIAPLLIQLKNQDLQQIGLIPCGLLAILPFHALFPEEMVIAYIPSASVLERARKQLQKTTTYPHRLLAVANPLPNPRPLPFAQLEVDQIRCRFPQDATLVLSERQAGLAPVKNALPGSTHLHFAGHGTFDLEYPIRSGLSLAGKEVWSLGEIMTGKFDLSSLRLVVLSACQTGMIDVKNVPDEIIGIPAGLMLGGIPAVISTLWPVADVPTAYLMAKFYEWYITEGLTPAHALHRAQLWLCQADEAALQEVIDQQTVRAAGPERGQKLESAITEASGTPFAHPYFWAGFYYIGPNLPV